MTQTIELEHGQGIIKRDGEPASKFDVGEGKHDFPDDVEVVEIPDRQGFESKSVPSPDVRTKDDIADDLESGTISAEEALIEYLRL